MEQIKEKELKEIIKNMNEKTVKLKIEGVISIEFTMKKVKCSYNLKNGILNIYDKHTNKKLTIEMLMAYMIKANENKQTIEIKLDNEEDITIHII